jgi:peptide/nickel transport system permease protein
MINVGAHYMIFGQWWPSVFPGLAVFLTAYALTGIGDRLRRITQREA